MKVFQNIPPPTFGGLVKRRAFFQFLKLLLLKSGIDLGPSARAQSSRSGLWFELQEGESDTPFKTTLTGSAVKVLPGCVHVAGSNVSYILEASSLAVPSFPVWLGVAATVNFAIRQQSPVPSITTGGDWAGWCSLTTPPELAFMSAPPTVKVPQVNFQTHTCPPLEVFVPIAHLLSPSGRVLQRVSHTIQIAYGQDRLTPIYL
jgi:hypothetical protein